MKDRSIVVLRILTFAFLVLLVWPGLAGAQSSPRHHPTPELQPQTDATAVASAIETPTQAGTWTPLVNPAPENLGPMMLLSDGTVAANGYFDNTWYRLTPDSTGSYVNGTWSQLASMEYSRLYFQSDMLPSGKIYVSGGEYGNAPNGSAEMYDPVAIYEGPTLIYNVAANTWSATACSLGDQDESTWVKLPDNSILTLDLYSTTSERYIPTTNKWIADSTPPVSPFNPNGELGGGFLLPNGKAFYIGGTNQTLIYTPSGNTDPGTWVQGPSLPDEAGVAIGANDAPAAMMANGNILMAEDPYLCGYCGPTYFFVYDYRNNSLAAIDAPGGGSSLPSVAYVMDMLDLPDGSVLLSPYGSQLYTFKPAGKQLEAGEPQIHSVTKNHDGSYHVTGTGFNGISGGSSYGDENQNVTNYPIASLTDFKGDVYYARTYNWSSTAVATGNLKVSTEMALPAGLPHGIYLLTISANGIRSDLSLASIFFNF